MNITDLDKVLNYLYEKNKSVLLGNLITHFDGLDVKTILEKLEKDGFVNCHVNYENKITFEGMLFKEDGGYYKKKKREAISANLQSLQTWALAVGTVLAGLYGLYELIKQLSNLCVCP